MKTIFKKMIFFLKVYIKNDFNRIRNDWSLHKSSRLLRRAQKMAYKQHMALNLRVYYIKFSKKAAMSIPIQLLTGRITKGDASFILITSDQGKRLVEAGLLNYRFWNERLTLADVHYIDGECDRRLSVIKANQINLKGKK